MNEKTLEERIFDKLKLEQRATEIQDYYVTIGKPITYKKALLYAKREYQNQEVLEEFSNGKKHSD